MITLLLHLLRLLPFLCGGHRQLALENLALHQQLAVYKRTMTRPRLRAADRFFWVGLARVWAGWRQPLVIVTPDTVLRWQRHRFREYWTKLSGRPAVGRPPVNPEITALVTRMAAANPLWGAPRIHGELLRLGIDVSERTVSRLMPKRRPLPSQTWRTFLANHVRDLVSLDFFTGNFSGWGSTSPSAPSLGSCRSGAPCRLRPGGRSSPTMSVISSPSISSRCQPCAYASSLFSSCSLTTADASSTST